MATPTRGRGTTASRPRSGWYRAGTTHTGFTGSKTKKTGGKQVASGYSQYHNMFTGKISSFKTLYNQTWGTAKCPRPTTTILNSFVNWVNKGAIVHTVTCAQVAKWARTTNKTFNTRNASVIGCKNVLCKKFGKTTIKAVARTKSGSFMVAASPTCKGKRFYFPQ